MEYEIYWRWHYADLLPNIIRIYGVKENHIYSKIDASSGMGGVHESKLIHLLNQIRLI